MRFEVPPVFVVSSKLVESWSDIIFFSLTCSAGTGLEGMDGVRVRNMNYIKTVRSVSTGQAFCGIAPNCLETDEADRNSLLLTNYTRLHI